MAKKIAVKAATNNKPAPNKVVTVKSDIVSPALTVQKTHIATPFIYPGTEIPRYGVVVEIDPLKKEHKKFLKSLEDLATEHAVDTIGHTDNDMIFIKFQTKEVLKVFVEEPDLKPPSEIQLDSEIPYSSQVIIHFDLNVYYNVKERKKGFNFCPTKVILKLDKKTKKLVEVTNVKAVKNSRIGPRVKANGGGVPKLGQRKQRNLDKSL
jgi:hypothetical protein